MTEGTRYYTESIMVDFDETDNCLRLWLGADLVGEMRPRPGADPDDVVAPWDGWVASNAIIKVFGAYAWLQKNRGKMLVMP